MLKKFDKLYESLGLAIGQRFVQKREIDRNKEMPKHFIKAKVKAHYGGIIVTFEDGLDLFIQPGDDTTEFLKHCWRSEVPHNGSESAEDVEGVLDDYWHLAKEIKKYEDIIKTK